MGVPADAQSTEGNALDIGKDELVLKCAIMRPAIESIAGLAVNEYPGNTCLADAGQADFMHSPKEPAIEDHPSQPPGWLAPTWLLHWLPLGREVMAFIVVGVIQICIDWMIFVGLTHWGANPAAANVSGRIIAATAGFWLNGKWTFNKHGADGHSLGVRHLLRYLVSWCITTAISTTVLLFIDRGQGLHWAWVAKPVVDGTLAALSFLASKYWIYRPHHKSGR
jgi:putative flippase GtrA